MYVGTNLLHLYIPLFPEEVVNFEEAIFRSLFECYLVLGCQSGKWAFVNVPVKYFPYYRKYGSIEFTMAGRDLEM